MRQSHLMMSNGVIIWLSQALALIPQLILVPFLIARVGEDGYGTYALIWSLMASTQQLQLSLQSGVVKYSASFLAQGLTAEVSRVVSSSFVYSVLLSMVGFLGSVIWAASYGRGGGGHLGSALVVVGIMILLVFPLTPYIAVIQATQRYYVGALANAVSSFISLALIVVWFNFYSPSVRAVIVIMAAMLVVSRLVQVPIAYHFVPGMRNSPKLFTRSHFRMVASFGAATVVASICLALNSAGVRWLMEWLASTEFVAHLAIILMPSVLISAVIRAMTITVMPATSSYSAVGNYQILRELLIRGTRYTVIMALSGLIAGAFLLREAFALWVGQDYLFLVTYAFVLYASTSFMLTTSISHHMLKGLEKLRVVIAIYAIGLVIVPCALILILIRMTNNPYLAVVVGLAAGHVVCGCLQWSAAAHAVKASPWMALRRSYLEPVAVAAPIALVIAALVRVEYMEGLVAVVAAAAVALIAFLAAIYFLVASPAERLEAREAVMAIMSLLARKRLSMRP